MLKIGSHVGMKGPRYMLGSVEEALSYNATALMFYTGAPQNTARTAVENLRIDEAHKLLEANNIPLENLVVHAPYIINLGNTVKPETYQIAVEFLRKEIDRTVAMGAKYLVLHPGSHVKAGTEAAIQAIIAGLDQVLDQDDDIIICLETMSGKGTECGRSFEELKQIIDGVKLSDKLGVCLDTCHIHDAGYDLSDFDQVLAEFDRIIGLDHLHVLHINDSKNPIGSNKDRHENLGYGYIGFETLCGIVNHPQLADKIKVLETPYVEKVAPYGQEIEMLRSQTFVEWIDEGEEDA
ncbi:deoxyribonuclease IV [Mollicutes bacterium LVI A0039]|nr:deoxyribonuclease IV [Mollicutes bacterium LVI A0039]